MQTFKLYKHKNNTDLALEPVRMLTIVPEGIVKIKCFWHNIVNPKNTFRIGRLDNIEIKLEDIKNWEPYEPA
jgi:hypothetical protein